MRSVITIHRAICDSAGTWGVERRNIKTVNCHADVIEIEADALGVYQGAFTGGDIPNFIYSL